MKYSLSFLLQKDIYTQLGIITQEISKIFEGQEIPVRWLNPEDYKISLHDYYKLSPLHKAFLEMKLKNFSTTTATISLHGIKLGNSKRMKGLVYFSIDEGGEHLRNLKSELGKKLKIKETSIFIPNIVIGRVSKDLTKQEYSNILKDLENLQESVNGVKFSISNISLIKTS